MNMICSHCGAQMEEDSVFCLNCGAVRSAVQGKASPLPKAEPQPRPVRQKVTRRKISTKAICISVAALVVLIVAAVMFFAKPQRPYTAALDKAFTYDYFSSWETLDALAPEAYWEKENPFHHVVIGSVMGIINPKKDFYEDFLGTDLAFSYDFKDVTAYSRSQVAMFGEALERKYGIDAKTVTEARHLVFDMTAKGEKGMEKKHGLAEDVIKIDGEWYCFSYYVTDGTLGIMFHRQ